MPETDRSLISDTLQWTIVILPGGITCPVRSCCNVTESCFQAVFASFRLMASQNAVRTWAVEGVKVGRGEGVGDGEGLGNSEGVQAERGASLTLVGGVFALWNRTTHPLSNRKSVRPTPNKKRVPSRFLYTETPTSGLRKASSSTSVARARIPPPTCQIGSRRLSSMMFTSTPLSWLAYIKSG